MTIKKWAKRIGIGICITLVAVYAILATTLYIMDKTVFSENVKMEAARGESNVPHAVTLLDRGSDSLYYRVQMIREAQKSIELEFFIFDLDRSSQIITSELIKKAKEGVQVRILVDFSAPVFKLAPAFAKYLSSQGVKVKYYNTVPLYRIVSSQHRSHRKLLIADDKKMITGGRNIANDYFDLGENYNFIDSDILIEGDIVKTARVGFDEYFNSDLSENPDFDEATAEESEDTKKFFATDENVLSTFEQVKNAADTNLAKYKCNKVVFVTDPPAHGESRRLVFKSLVEVAQAAQQEIIIESPYFVLRDGGFDVLRALTDRGVHLEVLTNALHATDAVYAVGSILLRFFQIRDLKIDFWVMSGERPAEASKLGRSERWGLHAKRAVIDKRHVLVGTYNIDPRSANLNSELLLICKDSPELAEAVLKSFKSRQEKAAQVFSNGETKDSFALTRGATAKEYVLMVLTLPLANMFDFLL